MKETCPKCLGTGEVVTSRKYIGDMCVNYPTPCDLCGGSGTIVTFSYSSLADWTMNKEYQEFTKTTAVYEPEVELEYLTLGLVNEAGEVAGVVKKYFRGDFCTDDASVKVRKELGDVMWYISQLCNHYGFSIDSLILDNMDKLTSRKKRGVIKGSGDER